MINSSKRALCAVATAAAFCWAGAAQALVLTPGSLLGIGATSHVLTEYSLSGTVTETLLLTGAFSYLMGVAAVGGNVYVMDSDGKVGKIDLATGATLSSFTTTGNEALGDDGLQLLTLNYSTSIISRYTTAGAFTGTVSVATGGTGIDGTANRRYVAQHAGPDAGSIRIYDDAGVYLSTVALGLPTDTLSGLGYQLGDGSFWVATGYGDNLIRHYSATGALLSSFAVSDNFIGGLEFVGGAPPPQVPEPGSFALLGLGLALLGARRRLRTA